MWSFVDLIDDELSMANTTKKDIVKAKAFMKFVEAHCHIRQYSLQIKKCGDIMCCSPPRLSTEEFSKIKWLPDPTLTPDKAHFKTFEELYGKETTDAHCPSMVRHREQANEPASLFTAAKVRGVATCLACDKPRCLYCDKQTIYKENQGIVTLAIESNIYICGSPICLKITPYRNLSEFVLVYHASHLLSDLIIRTKPSSYPLCVFIVVRKSAQSHRNCRYATNKSFQSAVIALRRNWNP